MATETETLNNERRRIVAQGADIARFAKDIRRFLYDKLRTILRDIERGEARGLEAARVLGSLETSLKELGLDKELAAIQRIYAEDLKAIERALRGKRTDRVFTDVDRPMIEALIKGGYDQAATYVERYIGDIREQVGLRVLTGARVDTSAIEDEEGKSLERILDTELNTTVAAFHRSVTVSKAEDLGLDLFIYVGPNDDATRPFCSGLLTDRIPPVYSVTEIRAMPDQQGGLPVLQYGGGYNCRHQWLPIEEEEARARGWRPQGE